MSCLDICVSSRYVQGPPWARVLHKWHLSKHGSFGALSIYGLASWVAKMYAALDFREIKAVEVPMTCSGLEV